MKLNYNKNLEKFFGLKNKKIIITGCSGQIGQSFVETFINFGCVVIGIDLKKPKKQLDKNFYFYELNISDYKKNSIIFDPNSKKAIQQTFIDSMSLSQKKLVIGNKESKKLASFFNNKNSYAEFIKIVNKFKKFNDLNI